MRYIQNNANHIASFNVLKVFALAFVTYSHVVSVAGREDLVRLAGINIGQIGVNLFIGLSGYFSFFSKSELKKWCFDRFFRVYPAYWIVMVISFVITAIFGLKEITPQLVISQFLGIGFFTHGWNLVNIVSWFISLLLLCYAIVAIGKVVRKPFLIAITGAVISFILLFYHIEVSLSRHVLVFCLSPLIVYTKKLTIPVMLTIILILLIVGFTNTNEFLYSPVSLLLILLFLRIKTFSIPGARIINKYSYEYFLLHGIFLSGFFKFLHNYVFIAASGAIILSFLAAMFLHEFLNYVFFRVVKIKILFCDRGKKI